MLAGRLTRTSLNVRGSLASFSEASHAPFLASSLSLGLLASPPGPSFHTQRALPVGGPGGWDYVTLDSSAQRLSVPRSDRVLVLDLDGQPLEEIKHTDGVHGVALAPGLDRGFKSNGRSNTITIFKLSTLEVLGQAKATGEGPDAILFDPITNRVFSFNGRGQQAHGGTGCRQREGAGHPRHRGRRRHGRLGSGAGSGLQPGWGGQPQVIRQETGDRYSVLEQVPTKRGARTMALDEKTHQIYLPTAEFGPTPAPAAEAPRARPIVAPNSFQILVVGR